MDEGKASHRFKEINRIFSQDIKLYILYRKLGNHKDHIACWTTLHLHCQSLSFFMLCWSLLWCSWSGSWTCWTTSREGGQPGQCGQRGGGGHRGGGRREGGHNGYEKKDEEMVYKITKEKPFFLQYVPIFLNGIVKVNVVPWWSWKLWTTIMMRGRRRGSKEKDKVRNTYKIIFISFLNVLMWHEYEYYRKKVGLVQIFHSK